MDMTEPHSTAVIAVTGSISLVAGTLFGLPVAALVFGFFGGLAALKIELPRDGQAPRGLWSKVTTAALGTVAAAAAAHPVAEALHPAATPTAMWLPLAAFLIGAGAEMLLRAALLGIAHRIRQVLGIERGEP
jgi:hypothetical protein